MLALKYAGSGAYLARRQADPLKIGIDIDGVLCDQIPSLCRWASERYKADIRPGMIIDYDVEIGGRPFGVIVYEAYSDPGFVLSLPPYAEAVEGISLLKDLEDVELLIVTSRRSELPTVEWIERYFDGLPIHFAEDKRWVNLDVLVDDHGPTVLDFCESGKVGVLWSQPYNQDWHEKVKAVGGCVVDKWMHVERLISDLPGELDQQQRPFATNWIIDPRCPWNRYRTSVWNYHARDLPPSYGVLIDSQTYFEPDKEYPELSPVGWAYDYDGGMMFPRGIERQLCETVEKCIRWIEFREYQSAINAEREKAEYWRGVAEDYKSRLMIESPTAT